jgi:hypothetical protein
LPPFDRVYVINLPPRETTLEGTKVYAKPPHGGFTMNNMRRNARAEFGVNLSHIKAVVRAIHDGAERPLFLEEDVEFIGEIPSLPLDFDVLYLGGHPRSPTKPFSDGVVRVGTFSFAEAYSLSRKALLPFYDFWCDRIGQRQAMYDFILGEFAGSHIGYACHPVITRQRKVVSHVSGDIDEKGHLVAKGWQQNT